MKRLLLVFLLLVPVAAFAQLPSRYAAKFVCGKPTAVETGALAIAPGTYFTAINVHYPSVHAGATVRKRFSYGKVSEKPGQMSGWINVAMLPGETILIDCHDILSRLGNPPFAEGIAEIEATTDLDVIGVYTSVGASSAVTTMEIDRVPKR
jgi:hypothetical protein